jgi:hypothetical protein
MNCLNANFLSTHPSNSASTSQQTNKQTNKQASHSTAFLGVKKTIEQPQQHTNASCGSQQQAQSMPLYNAHKAPPQIFTVTTSSIIADQLQATKAHCTTECATRSSTSSAI